jgi:hypothetical protein
MKFRYLTDRIFLLSVALYAVNRWAVKPALPADEVFLRGYFNDLLVIPCALPPLLFVHRLLRVRHTDAPPDAFEVTLHLFIWSIFFELFAPAVSRARADVWDVVAYATGGFVSWALWNRGALRLPKLVPNNLSGRLTP